jgi:cysteine synthase A
MFSNICGNTPLIKINNSIYAKLETYNPTGSVKDRMISYVVNKAIVNGKIKSNYTLCEATSGNSGISLSAVAASMGLPCVIFMPSNMSQERKNMMRSYGSQIVESPPSDFETAIKMRDEYLANNANAWSPMQFSNPDNTECHRDITAPEIHHQVNSLNLHWGAFIHGSGTGGTIEGIRQYISRVEGNTTKVCMTVPLEEKHGIQGIGDGRDFLANPDKMDLVIKVSTQEAIDRAKRFAKETGLLVGISSGANLVASEKYVKENVIDGIVVTMLCDRGERYLSIY